MSANITVVSASECALPYEEVVTAYAARYRIICRDAIQCGCSPSWRLASHGIYGTAERVCVNRRHQLALSSAHASSARGVDAA